MKAIHLKTEYLKSPLGIDVAAPRLFWNCEGGVTQTAYQIIAEVDGAVVWDSGKVSSSQMTGITCPVEAASRRRVTWKVQLWDENDCAGEWSETAFFEWGLLKPNHWQAKWITGDYRVDKKRRYPVDCFRRRFSVPHEVKKARLYITACGLYEARLDGEKIGNFCLAPGITDYKKRVQYQT